MKFLRLFVATLTLVASAQSFGSSNNLTSQALGSAIGLFNLEYSYRFSEHFTFGLTWTNGVGNLGPIEIAGSAYGAVLRRYFQPALESDSWYVVMSAEKRDYQFTLRDEQKYFLGENRDWIVAGGVGYQWFWESFNIGIGIVGTNQSGLELKSRSGEIYRDKIDQSIGFDFTIGGKF